MIQRLGELDPRNGAFGPDQHSRNASTEWEREMDRLAFRRQRLAVRLDHATISGQVVIPNPQLLSVLNAVKFKVDNHPFTCSFIHFFLHTYRWVWMLKLRRQGQ